MSDKYNSLKVGDRVIGDHTSEFAVHGVITAMKDEPAPPFGTARQYTVTDKAGAKYAYFGAANLWAQPK